MEEYNEGSSERHGELQEVNISGICINCGLPLTEGQEFCPKCGTQKGETGANKCSQCGALLEKGQEFCTKCGHKINLGADLGVLPKSKQHDEKKSKVTKNKVIVPIIIIGIVLIAVVAIILITRGTPVAEISLTKTEITLDAGETIKLAYTISPNEATNKTVTWKSSNESIAKVGDGIVVAIEEGSCTITVTSNNGKTDTCRVVVEEKIDFGELFKDYVGETWFTLAQDGSYIAVDTNWLDVDDYMDYDAYLAVEEINSMLGFPESTKTKMGKTRSLDGTLSDETDKIMVSWTYHPNKGLEVIYEKKK